MLELILQSFVLMLIVAFALVAIAGNFLRHEQQAPVTPSRDEAEDFAPRVLALSAVRSEKSSRAA